MNTYKCPLSGCEWELEDEAAKLANEVPVSTVEGAANALGMDAHSFLGLHAHQARERVEQELERHMSQHKPKDWLPELMHLREGADDQRVVIERWLFAAMQFGYELGTKGLPKPDVTFDWSGGYPRIEETT